MTKQTHHLNILVRTRLMADLEKALIDELGIRRSEQLPEYEIESVEPVGIHPTQNSPIYYAKVVVSRS